MTQAQQIPAPSVFSDEMYRWLSVLAFLFIAFLAGAWPTGASTPEPRTQLVPPATIRVIHHISNTIRNVPVGQIDVIDLEDYVKRVVPQEMPALWNGQALQAQAVAARTYAWSRIIARAGQPYDVTDWTFDQVMGDTYHPASNAAVDATRGQYIAYNGSIILAQYCSETGDPTQAAPGYPYLQAVEDPVSYGATRLCGHRHGMSQWGAQRWASGYGWNYLTILTHYYTRVSVELPYGGLGDNSPPLAAVVLPPIGGFLTGGQAQVAVNASDATSGVRGVTLSLQRPGAPPITLGHASHGGPLWTVDVDTSILPDGLASITGQAEDALGNRVSIWPSTFGLDREPPTVTARLVDPFLGPPTVTLSLSAGDTGGSGLLGIGLSNEWLWEGETMSHTSGILATDAEALNGRAWRGRAGIDPPGVWTAAVGAALPPGRYRAYARLKVAPALTTTVVARLEVGRPGETALSGLHLVAGGDFIAPRLYQEMAVNFVHSGGPLEIRVVFTGAADLWLDRLLVTTYPGDRMPGVIAWVIPDGLGPWTIRVKAVDHAGHASADAILRLPPEGITATVVSTIPGWTAFALATVPSTLLAAEQFLTMVGGTELAWWERGGWVSHVAGQSSNNIILQPGRAYLLRGTTERTVTLWGPAWRPPIITYTLSTGWQPLVFPASVAFPTNAQELLNALRIAGGLVSSVARLDTTRGTWQVYTGSSGENFPLRPYHPYLVYMHRPLTWRLP